MSYHIYTTEGLVLSQRPVREADRIYKIYTRDFGLIRAQARGVRKESSKLRASLEPLSYALISLVKGREEWRITSADIVRRIDPDFHIAGPLALLEKLVQGEAHHVELFDAIKSCLNSTVTHDESFEVDLVAQILLHLGYLKESDLTLDKKSLIKAINQGLKESHLISR